MSKYVLYCDITETTGKELARELGALFGTEGREGITKLIRWGNTCGVGYNPRIVINHKRALEKAIDKKVATEVMRRAGIRVPRNGITVPCVGRSSFHTQGQNFWLCWETSQVESARREGAEYFIEYIPVKQEWRVHVAGGTVLFVQKKYESDRTSTAFMGIQGFRDRWHQQVLERRRASADVIGQAIAAVDALGLDFGGVDVIISINDGLAYVLETNTGPSLPTEETRRPYLDYFNRRFGER